MQQTDDDQEMLVAFRAPGEDAQTHHGVTGRYVVAADGNSENHAISLVLGRLYVYALVKNIPDETVAGILSLFRLAGVDIGQKHHHKAAISSFGGIVSRMCIGGVAQSFGKPPQNLNYPSCWRLIYDGVTLSNGATVTVVLICFTSQEGNIEVELLGCLREASSQGHHGH